MSFLDCVYSNANLSPEQKKQLAQKYDKLVKQYSQTMGSVEAAGAAANKIVSIEREILTAKHKATINDALMFQKIKSRIDKSINAYELQREASPIQGKWLFRKNATVYAVNEFMEEAHLFQLAKEREYTLAIADVIEKHRSKWGGLTQASEEFALIVDEILGKNTDSAYAKSVAKDLMALNDKMRDDFLAVGGVMGKVENWFIQRHLPERVAPAKMDIETAFKQWSNFITSLLDWNKMINFETGLPFFETAANQLPLSQDMQVQTMMRKIFDNIRSNGFNDLMEKAEEGIISYGKGGAMMRHSSSRFFVFKDADSYHKYNDAYGAGREGLFDAYMGHISGMARDVGLMKAMGAKPRNQNERLKQMLKASRANIGTTALHDAKWNVLSGEINRDIGQPHGFYYLWRGTTNLVRGSLMQFATLSTITDLEHQRQAAKMAGLPETAIIKQHLKLINPASGVDRRIARRLALITDAASGNSLSRARYAASIEAGNSATMMGKFDNFAGALSNFSHRLSGMMAVSDASKQAAYLGASGTLEEFRLAKIPFEEIPKQMKQMFAKFDMGKAEYDAIMRGNPIDYEGATFLLPEGMRLEDKEAALKYNVWLTELAKLSSNEPRLFTQAVQTGGFAFGTPARAVTASMMMFKGFFVTSMFNHFIPNLKRGFVENKWIQAGENWLALTLLGAISVQLYSLASGYDLEDMDTKEFWTRAFLKGGAAGAFADFALQDTNNFGRDLGGFLAGPMTGFITDTHRLVMGNLDQALDDKTETEFLADLSLYAGRYTPAINIWYYNLIVNRTIGDAIMRRVDKNFDKRIRNKDKRRKERGAEPYWGAK
jgi:hypothetical protein